ncbi:MAG: copper resistance CopC family protein [Janthinobacterium lividum]
MQHLRTVAAAAILALGTAALDAAPSSAHAFLKVAVPPVGSTVHDAPVQLVITFTEGVEPQFSTIVVQDAKGARVDDGAVHLQGGNTLLAVGLKALPPGTYKVTWHATAVDTHKTEGSYTFTVAL